MKWSIICTLIFSLHAINLSAGAGGSSKEYSRDSIFAKDGGMISFGARSTVNVFTNTIHSYGLGVGGSSRIQFIDRLGSEWFGDYMINNMYNKATRIDGHIGWNVMLYILKPNGFRTKFTPFIAAGHCFDYTGIRMNGPNQPMHDRWTSAVQMSVGCHYNITPKFDFSIATLYDLHLGREIDVEPQKDGSVTIVEHPNAGWEGHIMIIFSVHYKFAKLWKAKG
jgi:hypothetical protein